MMRKHLARLLALVMVLNLVLCVPVSAGAAEAAAHSFEADPVIIVTQTDAQTGGEKNVVVEETVPAATVNKAPVEDQTVTVELPLEDALTQTPSGETEPALSEDGTGIGYNAQIDGPEDTVPVSEALDLTVDVTDAETDADGNLTDITYEVDLNQQTNLGGEDLGISMNAASTVDPTEEHESVSADEYKVNLTVDGMKDDPTRVEHTYQDANGESKTEYYYNEANGKDETDTGKKYFTVVSDAVNKVVSLMTNFLGTFKVTSDAFEYTKDGAKLTDSKLNNAVKNADNGSTVDMLRDFSTGSGAYIKTQEEKAVTVDLNKHTYNFTGGVSSNAITSSYYVDFTLQNGTLISSGNGVSAAYTNPVTIKDVTVNAAGTALNAGGTGSQLTVDNSEITSANIGVFISNSNGSVTFKDSTVNADYPIYVTGNSNTVTVDNSTISNPDADYAIAIWDAGGSNTYNIKNATVDAKDCPIYVESAGNTLTVENSTISATGGGEATAIWDYEGSNTYTIEDSTVQSAGDCAIYHNGSYGNAKFDIIGSYISATGEDACAIYISGSTGTATNPGLNNLTLTDTEVTGAGTAVEVKFTNVTVNGGKLVALAANGSYKPDSSGSCTTGAALAVTDNADPETGEGPDAGKTGGTVVINDGYFKGAEDMYSVLWAVKENTADGDKAKITVNGGRYIYAGGLDKFTDDNHAVMSYNDGSDYVYGVLGLTETPVRPGYTFQGYTHNGAPITLAEAKEQKIVAVAQWEKTPEEAPAEAPTAPAAPVVPEDALIIVQPDSNGNDVEVELQGSTAVINVTTPDGEEAAVSKVTVTSVEELRDLGVDTVQVQLEKEVALELDVTPDSGMHGIVEVTRTEDTLVISDVGTEITIHTTELKEAADDALHISLIKGVITVSSGETVMFKVDVAELLKANGQLTVKLEDGILKIYDKNGNLLQEIKL